MVALKGALSWCYSAIRHHAKPRRVADSPTKHRPQISLCHPSESCGGGVRSDCEATNRAVLLHRLSDATPTCRTPMDVSGYLTQWGRQRVGDWFNPSIA